MTPTIATILALAAVAWALAWWDIQRRKHVEDTRYELLSRGVHDAVSHAKELDTRLSSVAESVAELERNPVSFPATKVRMDVIEKAMGELVKQTKQALDEQAQRNMTIVTRLDARRGMRPSG